jgi:hypothetical protein
MATFPAVGGMLFGDGAGDAGAEPVDVGGGKAAKKQDLQSPHSGLKATLSPGEPLSRSTGNYGKGHSFSGGLSQIRGGKGNIRRNPTHGGLGMGSKGVADYSAKVE